MKLFGIHHILLICIFLGIDFTQAQVVIGKKSISENAILDFATDTTNGIILPIVNTLPTSPSVGTILMDKNDSKVKMYDGSDWIPLNDEEGDVSKVNFNTTTDNGVGNKGVIIGNATSEVNGVLILNANDKALILPKVKNPHENVKNPYPGMICYDTSSKTLATFDGLNWNYWK